MSQHSTGFFPTPFGVLVGKKRREAQKSVRQLAKEIGISHVFLGDVERGKRNTLGDQFWPALLQAVPNLTRAELLEASTRSSSREVRPWEFEGQRRELAARVAETVDRLNENDFTTDELERLLSVFRDVGRKR